MGHMSPGKTQKTTDNAREWRGLSLGEAIHVVEDHNNWQRIVQQTAVLDGS